MKRYKLGRPKRARDGSTYNAYYSITNNDELIVTSEYACKLAGGRHTYVLEIIDSSEDFPMDWKREKFNELVLAERAGRFRHILLNEEGCLNKLLILVCSIKSELNSDVIQLPYHSRSINLEIEQWKRTEVQPLMIDLRTENDKKLFVQQQSGLSIKINEMLSIRPQMQVEQLTQLKFKSSVHATETRIVHIVGPSEEDQKHIKEELKLEGKIL